MRYLFSLALVAMLWITGTAAQEAPSMAIQNTISGQFEAFKENDVDQAFEFASPSIRNMFRSADNFGAMVRNGYPMVWRPGSVRFSELREISGVLWQKVIVEDMQGGVHVLDYRMVQVDGAWKISAVQLLPQPDVAA